MIEADEVEEFSRKCFLGMETGLGVEFDEGECATLLGILVLYAGTLRTGPKPDKSGPNPATSKTEGR